jgi:hypothetical protein
MNGDINLLPPNNSPSPNIYVVPKNTALSLGRISISPGRSVNRPLHFDYSPEPDKTARRVYTKQPIDLNALSKNRPPPKQIAKRPPPAPLYAQPPVHPPPIAPPQEIRPLRWFKDPFLAPPCLNEGEIERIVQDDEYENALREAKKLQE